MDIEARVQEIRRRYSNVTPAQLLCDSHPPDSVAFTFVSSDLERHDVTFGQLAESSKEIADALRELGVEPGDRVASLMGKGPGLVEAMLGLWRVGAVYVPLFTAFGPRAIGERLHSTKTTVVIADHVQKAKLSDSPDLPDACAWTSVVADAAGTHSTGLEVLARPSAPRPQDRSGDESSVLVHALTSGTTGRPKSVLQRLDHLAGWEVYLEFGLGLEPEETLWCAADPGWSYGLYTALVAPMALGRRSILAAGGFDPAQTLRILAELEVENFAAAPTVYRALRSSGQPVPTDLRLVKASSAGEPLTPEINDWAREALGVTVHDHYGQTELGMVIGNHHHRDLHEEPAAGAMGRPLPGWRAEVLQPDADAIAQQGTAGRLAINATSPLMSFRGYGNTHSTRSTTDKLTGDGRWYLTGDAASKDDAGRFRFSARDDDVIIMAGYRIGPFDIESVMVEHPAVAECAVIGVPDELRGEVIEAVVVTRAPYGPSRELERELQELVKYRYASHAYPRRVRFVDELPKTPSGKVQRHRLRLPAGNEDTT